MCAISFLLSLTITCTCKNSLKESLQRKDFKNKENKQEPDKCCELTPFTFNCSADIRPLMSTNYVSLHHSLRLLSLLVWRKESPQSYATQLLSLWQTLYVVLWVERASLNPQQCRVKQPFWQKTSPAFCASWETVRCWRWCFFFSHNQTTVFTIKRLVF